MFVGVVSWRGDLRHEKLPAMGMVMNFSMSPVGIGIVVFIHLAVLVIFPFIWHRLPQGAVRRSTIFSAAMLATTAATTWDAFVVGYNKDRYCKEAGVRVYRQVAVEGFYDGLNSSWDEQKFRKSGFGYIEYHKLETANGREVMKEFFTGVNQEKVFYRLERDGDEIRKTRIKYPLSRYHILSGTTNRRTAIFVTGRGNKKVEINEDADTAAYLSAIGITVYNKQISHLAMLYRGIVLDTIAVEIVGEQRSYFSFPPWVDRIWITWFDDAFMKSPCKKLIDETPAISLLDATIISTNGLKER